MVIQVSSGLQKYKHLLLTKYLNMLVWRLKQGAEGYIWTSEGEVTEG